MKIVLGGSRHLEFIPEEVKTRLLEWIDASSEFLVGDASGIDKEFQRYLNSRKYGHVTVFTSAEEIRNNLGDWPKVKVDSGLKSKSNAVHAFKDRAMSQIAELGLMIWDCRSAGTLSNIIDLIEQGKICYVWVAPDSELYQFDNTGSLSSWMKKYPEVRDDAIHRLVTFRNRKFKRLLEDSQPGLFG